MDSKKPTWLNLNNYYADLYTIKELNYGEPLPGIYTSLAACAKAIYEEMCGEAPTEEQISMIVNKLEDDREYETGSGFVYSIEINNVWDII